MKKTKIKVGDKEFPCRVTMGAMVRFKNESGKDVSKLEKTNISELVLFVYCCVKSACNADKVEFDYDFESFADLWNPTQRTPSTRIWAVKKKKTTNQAEKK